MLGWGEVVTGDAKSYAEKHLAYRADIDGLRALAVLAVVLYHAFPTLLPGGFTGVDVFFVISGYLISGNIYKELSGKGFSFVDFYRRRIRRIFPALVLVLASCLAFGWIALYPGEYQALGKHAALGAGFVSNIGFFLESGYFDVSAITKPLLHLWSLGVEEQFYIVWPVVAILLWRRAFVVGAVLLAAAAFIASIVVITGDQPAAFYLPHLRFWELAVGALLAYAARLRQFPPFLSWVGLVVIAAGYALVPDGAAFPGYWALLPVIGAALVIAGRNGVLSAKPLVFIGLVSFPFYLWHWPLLSFAHIVLGSEPSVWIRVELVVAAFLLACLTYYLVERPLRFARNRAVTAGLVIAMASTGLAGWAVLKYDGYPDRKAAVAQKEATSLLVGPMWRYSKNDLCVSLYPDTFRYFCSQEKPEPPTVILIGNSYANHLYAGLVEDHRFSKQNILSYGSCEPGGYEIDCVVQEKIVAENPSIKFAIINELWPRLNDQGQTIDMVAGGKPKSDTNTAQRYEKFLNDKIDFLNSHGVTTIIFQPKPETLYESVTCFSRPFAPAANSCELDIDHVREQQAGIRAVINRVKAKHPEIFVFEQNPLFCDGDVCSVIKDQLPLLRDNGHYNERGSLLIIGQFADFAKKNGIPILD
ncbi:acyltransferase family protein [Pseudomonas fluorescens]|jgi:peptidoglycan/LPS O-acetylase OafA/YrhL|uniref:acyltransferase family protein n=1 Tax=Pseudomonas fluorescens TaxID=294 RepID=UPI00352664B9